MSEPLGSPIGSRREETESLFEQLRREWLLQKSKYVNKRESFAYKPLPPQTAVDVAKLWTSSAHVGIIPLEKTSPAEEAESSETKSEDDYDTDSSSTWSRPAVFGKKVIKEKEVNKLLCQIHSRPVRDVGLFEEVPDTQCSNPSCQFHSPPKVTKKQKSKRTRQGSKSVSTLASPPKRRRTYCPLPITSNSKRDSLEKSKDNEKNTVSSTPPLKESSNKESSEKSTEKTPSNSDDETNNEPNTHRLSPSFSDVDTIRKDITTTPKRDDLTRRMFRKRFFMQATDGSVGGTAGRDRTQRPNILKRRLSNNVRVEIENKAGDQHDDLGEPEMNRPRILPDEPRRDFNLRQDVLQLPHEIGLANKGNTCYVNATFQALFVLQDFVEDLKKLLIKKKELHPCLELFVNLALARRNGVTFEVDKLLTSFTEKLVRIHAAYAEKMRQQDASEFLYRLLEIIRFETPSGVGNPADDHFQFQMSETLRCVSCQAQTTRTEGHLSLCLPISDTFETLQDCLDAFLAEDEREVNCETCKTNKKKVSYRFETLPKALFISVKRFLVGRKVTKEIVAPGILDLKAYMNPSAPTANTQLQMVAKISHSGESLNVGHYVAEVLCDDGLWRQYDDKNVKSIAEVWNVRHKEAAYMYFYRLVPS